MGLTPSDVTKGSQTVDTPHPADVMGRETGSSSHGEVTAFHVLHLLRLLKSVGYPDIKIMVKHLFTI